MAMILLGLAAFYHLSNQRVARLSHLQWVVDATRKSRDHLETLGRIDEANRISELADTLSSGCGHIALKMSMSPELRASCRQAAMVACNDGHLNRIGVSPGALNHLPTKNALYWLAKKASD